MKKTMMTVVLLLVLAIGGVADACVGKILYIGIPNTATDQLLAELVAGLVTERTGTTVKILQFKDVKEIYAAVKKGEVGLVIENRDRAADVLGKPRDNSKNALEAVKRDYREKLNLVWLDTFGGNPTYAPVITNDTLSALPALPKLLNKLSGILTDDAFTKLVKAAKTDDKPKKVARDFLRAKRLI